MLVGLKNDMYAALQNMTWPHGICIWFECWIGMVGAQPLKAYGGMDYGVRGGGLEKWKCLLGLSGV